MAKAAGVVPVEKLERELKKFFDLSYDYVASLKPKPTTRKKKAKKDPA